MKYKPTSYSLVVPIAPCSWIAKRVISVAAWAQRALTRLATLGRFDSFTDSSASRMQASASSTWMRPSTKRCCSAWKLPIGLPNCSRTVMYSRVRSSERRAMPVNSALCAMRARSLAASRAAWAMSPLASRRAGASSNVNVAVWLPSTPNALSTCRPGDDAAIQTSARVSSRLAVTIQPSPPMPGRTNRFWPVSFTSSPCCVALVKPLPASTSPACSCHATPATVWPVCIAANNSSLGAPLGRRDSNATGCTPASIYGSGSSSRPTSVAMADTSATPRPRPPSSSGTRIENQPNSAIWVHVVRSNPPPDSSRARTRFR